MYHAKFKSVYMYMYMHDMYMYMYIHVHVQVHVGTCTCELLTRVAGLAHVVVSVGAVQAAGPRLFRRHAQAPAEAGM